MSAREHFEFPRSPFTQVPKSALKHVSSERLNELSVHKERREYHIRTNFSDLDYDFTNSGVHNKAALKAEPSERIKELASPRRLVAAYTFAPSPYTIVPASARRVVPTDRVVELSQPKSRGKAR